MTRGDFFAAIAVLAVTGALTLAYLVRFALWGRARFARVDQQGAGLFLRHGLMEMGYWGMQPFTRACIRLGVSANFLTLAGLGAGAVAGFFFSRGNFGWAAVACVVTALFDLLDGDVARATGTASRSGKMLDSALDRWVDFFLLAGIILFYRESPVVQGLGLLALFASFFVSYVTALGEIQQLALPAGYMRRPERLALLTLAAVLVPITQPRYESGIEPFAAYPIFAALGLIAFVGNISATLRVMIGVRELQRLQSARSVRISSSVSPLGKRLDNAAGARGPDMNPKSAVCPHAP